MKKDCSKCIQIKCYYESVGSGASSLKHNGPMAGPSHGSVNSAHHGHHPPPPPVPSAAVSQHQRMHRNSSGMICSSSKCNHFIAGGPSGPGIIQPQPPHELYRKIPHCSTTSSQQQQS
uniref:Uncharacterized protein n=1 Tax=Anopheles maculatus TaxID=74869 RepID=A0A182S667_9DIPT